MVSRNAIERATHCANAKSSQSKETKTYPGRQKRLKSSERSRRKDATQLLSLCGTMLTPAEIF